MQRSSPQIHDVTDHADVLRALLVERYSRWVPTPTREAQADLDSSPATRDGLPFEPVRAPRPRRGRPKPANTRRTS